MLIKVLEKLIKNMEINHHYLIYLFNNFSRGLPISQLNVE